MQALGLYSKKSAMQCIAKPWCTYKHTAGNSDAWPAQTDTPDAPDVQNPLQALLHRCFMEEGYSRSSAGHIHNDLSQSAHLFLRPIAIGDVVVLRNHVPILPALAGQYLLPAPQPTPAPHWLLRPCLHSHDIAGLPANARGRLGLS